jgi:hypothetical protein
MVDNLQEIPRNKIIKIYDENDTFRKYYRGENDTLIPIYTPTEVFIVEKPNGIYQTHHIIESGEIIESNLSYKIEQ